MNGVRFYADYGDRSAKRKGGRAPNGLALLVCNGYVPGSSGTGAVYEAVVALTQATDAPVCTGSASSEYLSQSCKRISEAQARATYPQLFKYLED